ncbi:MAG: F0F1 ATP synthase subunit delta [bacterium]|nr:F0F1 ATP synthase subunit delta [bacterium]MDN5835413.1 F0F1 ATP synthase subunit delta [bacterium]
MSKKLSRRTIAQYCANQIIAKDDLIIKKLAAFLVDSNRTREAILIVRDIESALASSGTVVARVVVAHELQASVEAEIKKFIAHSTDATKVAMQVTTDASLLGGISIDTPDHRFDDTVQGKLKTLRANKV